MKTSKLVLIGLSVLVVAACGQQRAAVGSFSSYGEESVNVGYGSIKRKNLTTSVSKLKMSETEMSSYTNIGEYIAGRVPGVQVTKTGGSYKYIIRGVNTIYGSNDPLFIVDGMEVADIDYINPREVKSVEVLKDASSSIYGSRGACGVIIITTRRADD
jgi:TonB-dependent SusC/RagA subfamily outer membrane receptor